MKYLSLLVFALICLFFSPLSFAQDMPLVYDSENTCTDCPNTFLPTVNNLPSITPFPDPFEWSDGRGRIKYFSDWKYRRNEISDEIQQYEIGTKPGAPDDLQALLSDDFEIIEYVLSPGDTVYLPTKEVTVKVTVNDNTLTLKSTIILPDSTGGPYPLVMGMGSTSGSLPGPMFVEKGIAQIAFNHAQVMAHTQTRGSEPINNLYPDLTNMGSYSAWPWGVSRLIDGLELVEDDLNLNLDRMAVTGCSYAGKMALFSGAFDERIALTISIESGGGGYTSWRYSDTMQGVEKLSATNGAWFKANFITNFGNAVEKLPYDHHELMAMVAPRALFVTGNDGWTWLADESGTVASEAAQTVYDALDIPDRFGYYNMGGHNHCALTPEKQSRVEAFVDKFLLDDETAETNIAETPYSPNLSNWITWETPELTVGESYWTIPTLSLPENEASGVETNATFEWEAAEGAQNYHFMLSENSSFSTIVANDTLSTTNTTVSGLKQGFTYYWKVRIENTENEIGPWSDALKFTTYIPAPSSPKGLKHSTLESRDDRLFFSWEKTQYASKYRLEMSEDSLFSEGVKSSNTSDTTATVYGTNEGDHYYWRVQGSNISGAGEWSEVMDFTFILAPSQLNVVSNSSESITLNWLDNSDIEDGFIIERKQGLGGTYAVIDSLKGADFKEYTDNTIAASPSEYIYRVKAFVESANSYYSNEASLAFTSIEYEYFSETPGEYVLKQNYPNPFNPTTQIQFGLPQQSHVKLEVYNINGQKVKELLNAPLNAGSHTITFNAENLASGIYIYRLNTGNQILTNKMILMK